LEHRRFVTGDFASPEHCLNTSKEQSRCPKSFQLDQLDPKRVKLERESVKRSDVLVAKPALRRHEVAGGGGAANFKRLTVTD
jgi:hypothetical protein